MLRHAARLTAIAAVALSIAAAPAAAQVFNGSLTAGPTFNRPLAFPQGGSCILSGVGTAVFYDVLTFSVTADGEYTVNLDAAFDPFGVLYGSVFNPGTTCAGAIAADDDSGPGLGSQLTANLVAGQTYNWVSTSFVNGTTGDFTVTIRGPGTATVVPEPSTYALIATGLAGLAVVRRRRRAA